MARIPIGGAFPPLRQLPGLFRLALRVGWSHLGGRAVAGTTCIVVDPEGRVAFVKARYRSTWSLPGGYCDAGEDPAHAAEREVREETGVLLLSTPRLLATRSVGHRVDHFFVALADPRKAETPSTGWEISAFGWKPWSNRPALDSTCAFVAGCVPGGIEELIAAELSAIHKR